MSTRKLSSHLTRTKLSLASLGVAAVSALVATLVLGASPAGAATQYPVTGSLPQGVFESLPNPAASPAGVNVPGCQLTAAHPRPVVLINGTFSNMIDDWSGLGPTLANQGYCVYDTAIGGSPYGVLQTMGPVVTSTQEISSFVNQVLANTGASQVDLVGHSQGGLIGEYYLKLLGGASKVHSYVGLSPTTHGTTLDGLATLAGFFPGANLLVGAACAGCVDQEKGSTVVNALSNGPIAVPGVDYTVIETHNETVVTPAGSSFINEPGVHNEWLQNYCPFDFTDHADLSYDHGVYGLVENALDPQNAKPVSCS
ncbi:MAG TPA: alpha/beta fold hydrolase [Pseudonocardiaceae bacterium]|nr:alpha/beta fold hydrolase [Pseudonocardiaceae bacterium]